MTDFAAETTRHYCRNPRCRSKLPAPVSNPREAFCVRGCHSGFYRTRCLVCEAKMERKTENQLICGKRRCRNALQARQSLGRYRAPSAVIDPLKTSIKPGVKSGVATDRPWRIVAGQGLTAEQLHSATIADGPNCEWKGGEYQRIEARNRALLREHFRRLSAKALIQRHHAPFNVLGGYRFPDAPEIDLSPIATAAPAPTAPAVVGDGLDIPGFLLRRRAA
ncbi:MAG: hypothetical protein WAV38_25220 [Xanthobacteraceae bacterium]